MTGQNRSAAVMQQRQEARDALDDFPTPMWATRALCEWLGNRGHPLDQQKAWDPAANRGYMVAALRECFYTVYASDVHDYGAGFITDDYLFAPRRTSVDWTITNPPFRLVERFITRALRTSQQGVAMFVRSAFLEGASRYNSLFSITPPSAILQFSERVVLHKGAMRRAGAKYWDPMADGGAGRERTASSATAYSWLVWDQNYLRPAPTLCLPATEFHWIEPCRGRPELSGDYDFRGDLTDA